MIRPLIICAGVAVVLMPGATLQAQVALVPNASGLCAVSNAPQSALASVQIMPNGIMSIFGSPQVIFKVIDSSNNRDKSYVLGERQQADGIAVIEINQTTGVVTFDNHGVKQKLRLPNASLIDSPVSASDDSFINPAYPGVPRPGGLGSGMPPYLGGDDNTGQPPPAPLTPDQQVLMIEAQRAYYKSKGDPESLRLANSLPPTAMTPEGAYEPADENLTSSPAAP